MYYRRDGSPIEGENAVLEMAKIFNNGDERVDLTRFEDGTVVSTVFLCLDHSHGLKEEKPLIFETMVFSENGDADGDMSRYSTEEGAKEGHKQMVEKWLKKLKTTVKV